MKTIRNMYLLLLIVICATSCSDEYDGDTFVLYDTQPASTYLSSRPDDFSEWITIMKYADLYNAVNQATQSFTLFIPNNNAVKEFYTKMGVSSIQELGEEYAKSMVKYHLIQDTINQDTFLSTDGTLDKKTVSDDYLTISYGENGANTIYLNKEGRVIEFANKVSNGYVYVLENVMTPLTESVYTRIVENSGIYSIFKEALDVTKWKDKIDVIYETVENNDGEMVEQKRNFTVLAVTDEVFKKAGINSLNDLVAKLNAGSDYTNAQNELNRYVGYHLISGAYDLKKLQSFDTGESKIWNTLAFEGLIKISKEDDTFYLNNHDKEKRTTFLEDNCNLQAKNGYIHQVAGWLPVAEPEPEPVLFDVTEFEDIKNLVEAQGAKYQQAGASEVFTPIEVLDVYDYKLNKPGGFAQKISYFTAKDKNSDWINANHSDYLVLNLGYNGWISIPTPSIMKGKYKVTIQVGFAGSMDFIRTGSSGSNGGQMKFYIDGENERIGKPYSVVKSKTLGNYKYVVYDENNPIEFTSTSPHQFKVVIDDPVASTDKNYRVMIDHLLFEPIKEEE